MRDLLAFGHREHLQRPSPLLRTMVGGVLRRTRLDQHRTLSDVAGSARISMQYLSEVERGRKEASSEILAALCAALGLDLIELLAAVGRDILDHRARPSRVIRLDAFRDSSAQTAPPAGPQQAAPQQAAPLPVAPLPATPLPGEPAAPSDGSLPGGIGGQQAGRSGAPTCLLAA